jgi:hypothetical protein
MRPDRIILQLRAELVTDLLVNRVNDFLAGKHRQTLLLIAPMQKQPVGERVEELVVVWSPHPSRRFTKPTGKIKTLSSSAVCRLTL